MRYPHGGALTAAERAQRARARLAPELIKVEASDGEVAIGADLATQAPFRTDAPSSL